MARACTHTYTHSFATVHHLMCRKLMKHIFVFHHVQKC